MAEWSNAAVLKTVDGQPSGGSNPSLSAMNCGSDHVSRLKVDGGPTAGRILADKYPGIRAVSLALMVIDHTSQPGNNFVAIAVHEPVKETIVVKVRVHKAFLSSIYIVGV